MHSTKCYLCINCKKIELEVMFLVMVSIVPGPEYHSKINKFKKIVAYVLGVIRYTKCILLTVIYTSAKK